MSYKQNPCLVVKEWERERDGDDEEEESRTTPIVFENFHSYFIIIHVHGIDMVLNEEK